jgi:hypothetical protein
MVPDYYSMLGIDPGSERGAIEAAIARCQPVWSAGTRNPKTKHTFQSYLDQIPQMRRVLLGDPSQRAAYDAELAADRARERERSLEKIQTLIRIKAAKGGLTVSDRALLRGEATQLGLDVSDLDSLIEPIPPLPEPPPEADALVPLDDVLDRVTRRQIELVLQHLGRATLYDVLDLPRDAPQREIQSKAETLRQRWMRKTQVTAEKTAWLEAISHAISHLGRPEARGRYDRTLQDDAEQEFDVLAEFAMRNLRHLDAKTRAVLMEESARLGILPDRAELRLKSLCRKQGIPWESPARPMPSDSGKGPSRWLKCRGCGAIHAHAEVAFQADAASCRQCHQPLRWDCPLCQRKWWVDELRCACGFRLEWREPMLRHFEAAQHAYKARDYATALEHLARVQDFAPHHVGTRVGIEKAHQKIAEIDAIKAKLNMERARRHLVAARAALDVWKRLDRSDQADLLAAWNEITLGLAEAHALTARAKDLAMQDPRAARALYRQSLAICADLPETHEGLRTCPPDPPTGLHGEFSNGRIHLEWTAPASDGSSTPVESRIVRKSGGIPGSPIDGTLLAVIPGTEYEDTTATSGQRHGYAVYTQRAGVCSVTAATCGPILALREVTGLVAESRSGEVRLRWICPSAAFDVRVVKRQGAPPRTPDDGEVIESEREAACDRNVQNERVYHYAVFARYRTAEGHLLAASGARVCVVPTDRPLVAPAPRVAMRTDGSADIRWDPPRSGEVRIARSLEPFPDHQPRRLSEAQALGLSATWLPAGTVNQIHDQPPAGKTCYYTSALIENGQWILGPTIPFRGLPDPTYLRVVMDRAHGRRLLMRWRWPAGVAACLVLVRAGQPPDGPDDPRAIRSIVRDRRLLTEEGFALDLPSNGSPPWHIQILAMEDNGNEPRYSQGKDPTSRAVLATHSGSVLVKYHIKRRRFPKFGWYLEVETEPAGAEIPPLVVVSHPRTVPLSADDGVVIARLPALRGNTSVRLETSHSPRGHRVRVFIDPSLDPESLPLLRFRHPTAESTRV